MKQIIDINGQHVDVMQLNIGCVVRRIQKTLKGNILKGMTLNSDYTIVLFIVILKIGQIHHFILRTIEVIIVKLDRLKIGFWSVILCVTTQIILNKSILSLKYRKQIDRLKIIFQTIIIF